MNGEVCGNDGPVQDAASGKRLLPTKAKHLRPKLYCRRRLARQRPDFPQDRPQNPCCKSVESFLCIPQNL